MTARARVGEHGAVTRAQAIERVAKLREITVQRGATPAEEELAQARATALVARFGLEGATGRFEAYA
jgi:isocitrate lyase